MTRSRSIPVGRALLKAALPAMLMLAGTAWSQSAPAPSAPMDHRKALQELFKDKQAEGLHKDAMTMFARRYFVVAATVVCSRVDPAMAASVNELKEAWLDHNRDYLTVANVAFNEFSAQIEQLAGPDGKERYRQRHLSLLAETADDSTRQYLDGATMSSDRVPTERSCNRFRDQISSGRMDFVFSPETTIELKQFAAKRWPSMKL